MMIRQYNYRRIVGSRIKLYLIKNIYSGYYSQDGKEGKCPKCLEENFMINTDISRLKALQFHHSSNINEKGYSANNLLRYFSEDKNKIVFLKKLIESAEHEEIDLLCGGHHITLHDDYFNQFKDLISWKDIFSLSADEINMLLITAIENFHKTKNLSVKQKLKLRENILNKLKKRYIIELFYGDKCHTCGEFNTRDHLPLFEFNHTGESYKTQNIADAFHLHSCSEIVQIIESEGGGGYICSNCHSVLHFAKYIPLLDKIFDDVNIINRIRNDFKLISERFKSIKKDGMIINDPLKKVFYGSSIRKALKILVGIKKLTDLNIKVTHLELESVTGINRANIFKFFRDNDLIKNYINIEKSIGGKGSGKGTPTIYSLNNRGAEFIEIIEKFKNLYKIQ